MIFRHYRELATPEQAGTSFKIMPDRQKTWCQRNRMVLERISGLPPDLPWVARLRDLVFGGGLVFLILITNFLIRQGRLKWLAKD